MIDNINDENKQITTQNNTTSSFKKIKIVEEVLEDVTSITPELSKLYMNNSFIY